MSTTQVPAGSQATATATGTKPKKPAAAKAPKPKHPCLRCRRAVTKDHKSVQCQTCQFWVHTECQDISDELFRILADPESFGGVCWNCDSCLASSARLERTVIALETRVNAAETVSNQAISEIKRVDSDIALLRKELDEVRNRTSEAPDLRLDEYVTKEELREREARKTNIIMHRVAEAQEEFRTAEEKRRVDTEECRKIFRVLDMEKEGEEDINFCRRIGERGEEPRPLVVVLRTEEAKRKLLGRARNLRDSIYQDVGIVPDLTVAQRNEEYQLAEEAERRNEEELTQEDISKNLKWLVVGQRGAKKLIKAVPRDHQGGRGRGGPRARRTRGGNWTRRSGARGGTTTGANTTALGRGGRGGGGTSLLNPPTLLPPTELLLSTERETRQANKRIRDEVEEDGTAMEDSEYEEAEEMSPPRKK